MEQVHIPTNALVMIGDGRKALFLRNRGTPRHVELITEGELGQDNPPTREQGTDRPGRTQDSMSGSRSALDETDWHQQAEQRFATEIADRLYQMAHDHDFEELVLVAPPKMLGDLRAVLHTEVATRVVAEVPKDLTGHPVPDIARLLS
jgi:protein required for attachment to host cells